ncbi:MAG: hypothetical protein AB1485_07725 [Candidatus Thermoplasmatota archaeon]
MKKIKTTKNSKVAICHLLSVFVVAAMVMSGFVGLVATNTAENSEGPTITFAAIFPSR